MTAKRLRAYRPTPTAPPIGRRPVLIVLGVFVCTVALAWIAIEVALIVISVVLLATQALM